MVFRTPYEIFHLFHIYHVNENEINEINEKNKIIHWVFNILLVWDDQVGYSVKEIINFLSK